MEFHVIALLLIVCFVAPVHTDHPCTGYTGLKHFCCDNWFMMCTFWCNGQYNCVDGLDETDCWWEKTATETEVRVSAHSELVAVLCMMNMQTCKGVLCFLAETERLFEHPMMTKASPQTSTDQDLHLHCILWLDVVLGISLFVLLYTVIVCLIRHTVAVQRKNDNTVTVQRKNDNKETIMVSTV